MNNHVVTGPGLRESFAVASFEPCQSQVIGHEFLEASRESVYRYVRGVYRLDHAQFRFCSQSCRMLQDQPPQVVMQPGRIRVIACAVWALMQGDPDASNTLVDVGLMTTSKIMVDVLYVKAEMIQHARTVWTSGSQLLHCAS